MNWKTLLIVFIGSLFLASPALAKDNKGIPDRVEALEAQIAELQDVVAALQISVETQFYAHTGDTNAHHVPVASELDDLLLGVTRVGNTLTFSGMNVQIVNGTGEIDSTNGTGNLIIGYNASRSRFDPCPETLDCGYDLRDGSHMLVIGDGNNYTSYGGMVVGFFNETLAPFASVSGGIGNIAGGEAASVSGGYKNIASSNQTSISGGAENIASGWAASVSGGIGNIASGEAASVGGGGGNEAFGWAASVSGGIDNIASGEAASVSGGGLNSASGDYASVSGGFFRYTLGAGDWAAGSLWEND